MQNYIQLLPGSMQIYQMCFKIIFQIAEIPFLYFYSRLCLDPQWGGDDFPFNCVYYWTVTLLGVNIHASDSETLVYVNTPGDFIGRGQEN